MKPNLKYDGENDYTLDLSGNERSFWVTIGGISLYVIADFDTVRVTLCTRDHEAEPDYDLANCEANQP